MLKTNQEKVPLLDFLNKHSKNFIVPAVILAGMVTSAAVGLWFYGNNSPAMDRTTLAVVGGQKITRADLDESIYGITSSAASVEITKEIKTGLLKDLVTLEIYTQKAKELGITVSEEDIKERAAKDVPTYLELTPKQTSLVLVNAKNNLIREAVDKKVIREYKGEYVLLHYDKFFPNMLGGTDADTEALKKSIQPIAESIYNQIVGGTLTFADAITQVENDKIVDMPSYLPTGNVGPIGGKFTLESSMANELEFLENLSVMKIGEVRLFSRKYLAERIGEKTADGAFVIARLNEKKDGEANNSLEWINDQSKKLKAQVYYEKIN